MGFARRLPIGAEVMADGGVHFRVWAADRDAVRVVIHREKNPPIVVELERDDHGYFAGFSKEAKVGSRYHFLLDRDDYPYPDPATRFQPEGPHAASQVVEHTSFSWTDQSWKGCSLEGQVVYEMHIGTFTQEGTFAAATRELSALADLGVTLIELMPIAEFPGRFGWGYDGVNLFAPCHLYGEPDDLRRFVNEAHRLGVGVILDVVYNHFGPDGNYLKKFSKDYFTDRYENEWGEAINFDGTNANPVREFFLANVQYWIEEFHLDGYRLDATQQIFDISPENILEAIGEVTRQAAKGRATIIVNENEPQLSKLVRPQKRGGFGLNAIWNDDFHHSAVVAMTGASNAYYTDYRGAPQELLSAIKWGFLFQGQRYKWQKQRRGTPGLDLPPATFVNFIENHDQVANSAHGKRMHQLTTPGRYKAMSALLLLAPNTPMIFQGQEFASSKPFFYFADHNPNLAELVHQGRVTFLEQFANIKTILPHCARTPHAEETFLSSKLDFSDREKNKHIYELYRSLLRLRKKDPVFQLQRKGAFDGAILGPEALMLRFFGEDGDDRLLLVNLGLSLHLDPAPEPLLAPPEKMRWEILLSTEELRFGGAGTPEPDSEENWRIPGHSAIVLGPIPAERGSR